MRWLVIGLALSAASCATTKSGHQALVEKCNRSLDADARCVEVLTGSTDTREAEKEVLQAEADRKRDAFQSRLQRLREAEENRQARRARTATVARFEDVEEDDRAAWLELLQASRTSGEDEDSGSSVRALTARPTLEPPRPPPPVISVEAPPPKIIVDDGGPTPQTYLLGARCLLRADLVLLRQTLESAKKNQSRDDIAGSIALVIVDADGMLTLLDQTIQRRFPSASPLCSGSEVRSMVTLLRELVGPRPKPRASGDAYGRGLGRLMAELQKRADLGRSE